MYKESEKKHRTENFSVQPENIFSFLKFKFQGMFFSWNTAIQIN